MRRKLLSLFTTLFVIVSALIVTLNWSAPMLRSKAESTAQATAEEGTQTSTQSTPESTTTPSQPIMWGVNAYLNFTNADVTAAYAPIPVRIVRWGGNASDSGQLNDDMTVVYANLMHKENIEPLMQLSLFHTKPEDATKLITYINIEKKAGIKYWSVGNEPELFQLTHKNDISLEDYLKQWRADVQAIKAADPSVLIVGPDVSLHMTTLDKSGKDWQWFSEFVKANGDLTDVISFHFYPFGGDKVTRDEILTNPDHYNSNLSAVREFIRQTLKRDVPLAITEVNLNWNGGVSGDQGGDSLFAGLWMAEICGISAEQGMMAVVPWASAHDANLSLIDGMNAPRPTFYGMQFFAGYQQAIPDAKSSLDGVKVYAGTTDKGLLVVLVNRTDKDAAVKLDSDITLGKDHKLDASTVTLGAYSMTRLEFDANGKFVQGTTYGQKEYDAKAAPSAVKLGS